MHPDTGGSEEEATCLIKAYTILGNPEKRKQYDATGDESDAPIETVEHNAMRKVASLLQAVLRSQEDLKTTDIVEKMKKTFRAEILQLHERQRELNKALSRCAYTIEKLTVKEKASFMLEAIKQVERECEENTQQVLEQLEISKMCTELLKDASFTCSERTQVIFTGIMPAWTAGTQI